MHGLADHDSLTSALRRGYTTVSERRFEWSWTILLRHGAESDCSWLLFASITHARPLAVQWEYRCPSLTAGVRMRSRTATRRAHPLCESTTIARKTSRSRSAVQHLRSSTQAFFPCGYVWKMYIRRPSPKCLIILRAVFSSVEEQICRIPSSEPIASVSFGFV